MLVKYALIIISLLVIESTAAALVDGNFEVNTATGRIQDGYGRERLFHGLNVVVKGPPWHPGLEVFDHQFSFCDRDVELIKSWGMNVVRLAVMWPGVEPREGWINATYLQTMRSIVRKLNSAGIYTLIEFHQDLFTSQFCGDGLPSWILRHTHNISSLSKPVQKSSSHSLSQRRELSLQLDVKTARNLRLQAELRKHESSWVDYVASFPEPLGLRWFTDPDEATQSQLDANCNRFEWFWYYISFAVSKSFQDLYENQWGWADHFADYWKVVAKAFRNEAGVLGYELMNEPWAGNFYRNPLLLLPGVADKINLAPFYEKLQAAVRSQDNKRIVFFESLTFDNVRSGFSTVPGGDKYKNKTVLSYHYYRPPNFSPRQIIGQSLKEGQKLGCGTMLTEFFVNTRASNDEFLDNNSKMFLGDPRMNLCHEQMARSSDEGNASSVVEERGNLQEICQSMEIIKRKMVSRMIGNKESVEDVLAAADEHVQSWIGWEYKPFVSKTGSDIQDSVFNVTGEVNLEVAKKLARTYPQAVFGRITSFSFDPSTADFSLIYHVEGRRSADRAVAGAADASANSMPSTQIFVHRAFHYASGIDIRVSHSCLHVKEFQNMILIDHSDPCHGKLVEIRISRKGTGNPI
ncbi:hypothetical protein O6H91_03G080600 [Diphasiastrum complanatum]|uniref:Uncharacterized protein n=1 Tax=Diphasiastrum complanatum TaxID=34168 RepID=A0ACC2E888_DIPCM|nr:hypothetical protein O6H91_03G080600 [Diphasiastrum complanatum]